MTAVTYGDARVPAATAPQTAEKAGPRKNFLVRFMEALVEARMRQARREVARHLAMLPYTLDERGNRIVKIGKSEMPFGGW
jgi:hypothetical protein